MSEQASAPRDVYEVPVNDDAFPSQEQLEALFSGPGSVTEDMPSLGWRDKESKIKWQPTRVNGTQRMRLFSFNAPMRNETVIAHARAQNYRPATHEELLAFAKTYPDLQQEFRIVALGTFIVRGGTRHFAGLGCDKTGRTFQCLRRGLTWCATRRLLFVYDPPERN